MMYYAVKVGRKPGLYTSWPQCRDQVHGFPSAVFKAFNSEQRAQDYLAGPMPRWARKDKRKRSHNLSENRELFPNRKKFERPATNPNGRTQFYSGPKPPWDFLSFIDCYGEPECKAAEQRVLQTRPSGFESRPVHQLWKR